MLPGLVSLVVALAALAPQHGPRLCSASFSDGGRLGNILLGVEPDDTPRSLTIALMEPDGWSRAEIELDPAARRLPGHLSHFFFAVRFTGTPIFPLTLTAYADGRPHWRRTIRAAFWPTSLIGPIAAGPGTADYLALGDDGLAVPTPRELRIVLVDARGDQVGETRYALPGTEAVAPMAAALAAVESSYRKHRCHGPPPPID